MKRIIEGKTYNTATATRLYGLSCNASGKSDFRWEDTSLYQTKGGAFFLAGEGGPMTRWGKRVGTMTTYGEGLMPITIEEAKEILEREDEKELIEQIFGTAPEATADGDTTYLLRLPASLKTRAAAKAEAAGMSLNAFAMRALEKAIAD